MKKIFILGVVGFLLSTPLVFAQNEVAPVPFCIDPIPSTIVVSPSMSYLRYGGDIAFKAHAYDDEGKLIQGFKPTSWKASGGLIDNKGWYVANVVGYHLVTANLDCAISEIEGPFYLHLEDTASVRVENERPR